MMLTFNTEDKEKELTELRKKQEDIGVTTESLSRLPVFEPTLKPQFKERVFENAYGRIFVRGRLGQSHKNVLETILYKRKAYKSYKDEEGNRHIEVIYSEYEVKKYLSKGTTYNKEGYQSLIEDLKLAYVEIETKELTVNGKLVEEKTLSTKYSKRTKSNLPSLKGEKIPYAILKLGNVINLLISEELKFTYDPRAIINLASGVSQAIVRYLKTQKRHPRTGYHLKELIQSLEENIEGQKWYNIKTHLKKDTDKLKNLGIVIDFKKDRLFVMQCYANGKVENLF